MAKLVNQNYNIPEGLRDSLSYEENVLSDDQDDGAGGADVLFPPSTFTIIQQNLHYANDGSLVVDIIAEVEDIEGVVKFDVRIAKTDGGDEDIII